MVVAGNKFVLGVDVGTTNIRCYVYDEKSKVIGRAQEKVSVIDDVDGRSEIKPETLWQSFQNVIKRSLSDACLNASDITSLGISTQRGTFITWDRSTGSPCHNFITWKDKRVSDMCERWNTSLKMKMLRFGAWLIYLLSGRQRYLAASRLILSSVMVVMRLVWVIQNIPQVSEKMNRGEILFGTIDTWLLWMLTGNKVHATDPSNASATGFFDPYLMKWSDVMLKMFKIPARILPLVKNTSDFYGETLPEIFGSAIRISALVGDQQSSMFGQCCFKKGDVNCTMGTGTFFDVNTGSAIQALKNDVYPLVGWTVDGKTTYIAECGNSDTGTVMTWANSWGLLNGPEESSEVASIVKDSGGVYFIPPFSKLQAVKKSKKKGLLGICTSGFAGLKPDTTRAHLVRAVLEAIVFRAFLLYESLSNEVNFLPEKVRICGGVSNNEFLVHTLACLLSKPIVRSDNFDSSSLGAAFFAGLEAGVWKSTDELIALPITEKIFNPKYENSIHYSKALEKWKNVASFYTF